MSWFSMPSILPPPLSKGAPRNSDSHYYVTYNIYIYITLSFTWCSFSQPMAHQFLTTTLQPYNTLADFTKEKTSRNLQFTQITEALSMFWFPSSYFFTLPSIKPERADMYHMLPYPPSGPKCLFSTLENENAGFPHRSLVHCCLQHFIIVSLEIEDLAKLLNTVTKASGRYLPWSAGAA